MRQNIGTIAAHKWLDIKLQFADRISVKSQDSFDGFEEKKLCSNCYQFNLGLMFTLETESDKNNYLVLHNQEISSRFFTFTILLTLLFYFILYNYNHLNMFKLKRTTYW